MDERPNENPGNRAKQSGKRHLQDQTSVADAMYSDTRLRNAGEPADNYNKSEHLTYTRGKDTRMDERPNENPGDRSKQSGTYS